MTKDPPSMKQRATVVCIQDDRILLVTRDRTKWSLPGGRIRTGESPVDAAVRELAEETTLRADALAYLFAFSGFNTRHYVFAAAIPCNATAIPSNEIERCRWFDPVEARSISASIPTRGILTLCCDRTHAFRSDSPHRTSQRLTERGDGTEEY